MQICTKRSQKPAEGRRVSLIKPQFLQNKSISAVRALVLVQVNTRDYFYKTFGKLRKNTPNNLVFRSM